MRPVLAAAYVPVANISTANICIVINVYVGFTVAHVNVRTRIRSIAADAPPAAVTTESETKRTIRPGNANAPTRIWVVGNMKTPSGVAGIIVRTVPRLVIPAAAVNDGTVIVIASVVTWRVANVNHFGSYVIDLYIGYVVVRIGCRNFVNSFWNIGRNCPWSSSAVGYIPNTIVTRII